MAKPTTGKFFVGDFGSVILAGTTNRVATSLFEGPERVANANLIAEAFNVYTETGMTPKELAEQRGELLDALEWLVALMPDPELDHDEVQRRYVLKAITAIAKAQGGGK